MDPRLAANRANWDDRVAIHVDSQFYDVAGWLRDEPGLSLEEHLALGELTGRSLVHLQCHFGMDTLRLARAGAIVTGVDFSPAAIREATSLARRAALSAVSSFVCCDVYDAPESLARQRFDVVYVSLGSLGWLPDIDAWGNVVASLLSPGGQLYLHDVHPFAMCLDDTGERVDSHYFEQRDAPWIVDEPSTYTDGGVLESTLNYQWNHSLAEIVDALLARGLVLDELTEHEWTEFAQFAWLTETSRGRFTIPEGRPRIPLSFTLLAHGPG